MPPRRTRRSWPVPEQGLWPGTQPRSDRLLHRSLDAARRLRTSPTDTSPRDGKPTADRAALRGRWQECERNASLGVAALLDHRAADARALQQPEGIDIARQEVALAQDRVAEREDLVAQDP